VNPAEQRSIRAAISQARSQKEQLEDALARHIQAAITDLGETTGLPVQGITVEMVDVTAMMDRDPRYVVGRVKLEMPAL